MKKIKPEARHEGRASRSAVKTSVKAAEKPRTSPRQGTSSSSKGRGARKPSRPAAPKGGWLARRPARPVHPATPIDEMAGIVLVACALLLALVVLAPSSVGALSPFGLWMRDALGQGGVILAACVLLVGMEAFIPHQALGVPMLALALGVLFVCLEGLADLMGGQGGRLGSFVGTGVRAGLGVPGAWIATVTLALIDIQWITRVSLRGPARWLVLPLRLVWRAGALAVRLVQTVWVRGSRGLWAFADGVVSERDDSVSDGRPVAESEGFVPPVTVKPLVPVAESSSTNGARRKGSATPAEMPTSPPVQPPAEVPSSTERKGGRERAEASSAAESGPQFPPMLEASKPVLAETPQGGPSESGAAVSRSTAVEALSKPIEAVDDDLEIPGYEEDLADGDEPIFDEIDTLARPDEASRDDGAPVFDDEPPFEPSGTRADADDADATAVLARAWAESEAPGARALSLPLPEGDADAPRVARVVSYALPPVDLLNTSSVSVGVESAADFSRVIVETLNSFGVATRIVNVEKGPTVTRYELQPARGVKVSKITSLNNDIALALAAQAIRIEAPIPGKSAIGIEVPNSRVDAVPMREIIESAGFQNGQGCMLALGKDISGRAVVADLLRMPHLLIAGATGSGKSVCLNTVIVSMLYRFTPQQVQMVMVDPKRVELSIFEGIPHLANTNPNPNQRIVKDAKTGTLVLKQATEIMNQRFELLSQNRVRNIAEYNAKADVPMPYLVIIVDELAQLMQISARSVEGYLQELAQMGRAAGIHLILATQRPSVDVLTGTIKSNFPARIAFAVSAQVDSRTILDRGGAEKLLGRGDMLFSPTDSELRRVQGCLITLEETERVVDFWRRQEAPDNLAQLSLDAKTTDDLIGASGGEGGEDEDLLREALRVIKETKLASASNLQRKLQIGYPRAARLVDELEQRGFLGPANGSKPRKMLFLEDVE